MTDGNPIETIALSLRDAVAIARQAWDTAPDEAQDLVVQAVSCLLDADDALQATGHTWEEVLAQS